MIIYLVQMGLYNDYKVESLWEDQGKAITRRNSLEAQGFENCKVIPMETSDLVTDEYWCYQWVADIDYNFSAFYVNNVLLDYPDRIMRMQIKKDSKPDVKYKTELTKCGDGMNLRIISYVSKEHCFEEYKKEYAKILEKFDLYKAERKAVKNKE